MQLKKTKEEVWEFGGTKEPTGFVSGAWQLAVPENLTMVTLNTNYTLRWDWDPGWSRDVTFTAEYVG